MKKAQRDDFGDLLKLGETLLSTLIGAGQQLGARAQQGGESFARKMDLVTREEFDAAFAMIKKMRAIQENLDKRISAIEKSTKLSSTQKRRGQKQIRPKK